jgi:UDP-N-acetylmuramoyl-tripeptide--D-alanyl-D-alanine ligase
MIPSPLYNLFRYSASVATDTRHIKQGAMFFALRGDTFDGNAFAAQAIEKGASCAVVSDAQVIPPNYTVCEHYPNPDGTPRAVFYAQSPTHKPTYVWVQDTLLALQELATYYRCQFLDIGLIALTGSNGKTTTKELLRAVLSTEYRVHATQGNLNNHIGVPLTLLAMPANTQIAIIEMGANHQHEIESLCQIAKPTHGLITGIGKAHLEGFGGIEGVAKGKGEMFEYLAAHGAYAFVNGNDARVYEKGKIVKYKTIYGNAPNSDANGIVANTDPYLSIWLHALHKTTHHLETQLVGAYNLDNVLAAVAVGQYFGIPLQKIMAALYAYKPNNSRSQRSTWGSNTLILDAYNANPTSMKAALNNLANLPRGQKAVILGEMRELGDESDYEHRQIVAQLQQINDLETVVLVGKNYQPFGHEAGFRCFDTVTDAKIWFDRHQFEHTTLLIKGSRGVALEKLFDAPNTQ